MMLIYTMIFFILVWLLGNHWMKQEARKELSRKTGVTEKEIKKALAFKLDHE